MYCEGLQSLELGIRCKVSRKEIKRGCQGNGVRLKVSHESCQAEGVRNRVLATKEKLPKVKNNIE